MNAIDPCLSVQVLRGKLWSNGYRPVGVYGVDQDCRSPGKQPEGCAWQDRARQNPPEAAVQPATPDALNTGLLCDGLRAIDVDVDDVALAADVRCLAALTLGETIVRTRTNTGRCLLVYRAAGGGPRKRALNGLSGKIEVLGRGQQFVAFGMHPSGVPLDWPGGSPESAPLRNLPSVTEDQITDFLTAAAKIIGAEAKPAAPDSEPAPGGGNVRKDDALDVLSALCVIPNDGPADWEHWNAIGMATFSATGGSRAGLAAFDTWSRDHPSHDPKAVLERWKNYHNSPPTQIGAGTLFRLAHDAAPGWRRPSSAHAADGLDALPPEGAVALPEDTAAGASRFFCDEEYPYGDIGWLVYRMLPDRGVAQMSGPSRGAKTFGALDLSLSATTGLPFAGREIDRQGGVLWLAAEGSAEVTKRWRAAKNAKGLAGVDLPFLWRDAVPGKLCAPGAADKYAALAKDAAAELKGKGVDLVLIVVDTIAAAAGWDSENANAEAQEAMDVLQGMSRATGALVIAIDHHGKTLGNGTRGASSKDANADARLVFLAEENIETGVLSNRRMVLHKCRGGPEGEVFPFALAETTIDHDRKGRPITTCTVEWLKRHAPAAAPLPDQAAKALRVLNDLLADGAPDVPEKEWQDACAEEPLSSSGNPKVCANAFRRARAPLLDRGLIVANDGRVALPEGQPLVGLMGL